MIDCPLSHSGPPERSSPGELAEQRRRFSEKGQYGELLECVPIPVMVLNPHGQIVYANRAILKLVGTADFDTSMGPRSGEVFGCAHASESERGYGTSSYCNCCGIAGAILKSREGREVVEECRIQVAHAQGHEALDLRVWAHPLRIGGDVFTSFALVDIANEKRNEYLEQVFLRDILSTVSALRGLSVLLDSEVVESETRRDFMERIKTLAERVTNEIGAHQQLVAAENNELLPEFKTIRSTSILRQLCDVYGCSEILDGRKLGVIEDSADIEFVSDPSLLEQVLGHMTRNAIEAALPSETVTLACEVQGSEICFWVHNATYIPENIRLQMFNRSFSTKGVGRGLGTYTMKYFTEKYLGGAITFSSTEREGTVFSARFPLEGPALKHALPVIEI